MLQNPYTSHGKFVHFDNTLILHYNTSSVKCVHFDNILVLHYNTSSVKYVHFDSSKVLLIYTSCEKCKHIDSSMILLIYTPREKCVNVNTLIFQWWYTHPVINVNTLISQWYYCSMYTYTCVTQCVNYLTGLLFYLRKNCRSPRKRIHHSKPRQNVLWAGDWACDHLHSFHWFFAYWLASKIFTKFSLLSTKANKREHVSKSSCDNFRCYICTGYFMWFSATKCPLSVYVAFDIKSILRLRCKQLSNAFKVCSYCYIVYMHKEGFISLPAKFC